MKKTVWVLCSIVLVLLVGASGYFYQLAGKSLYYKYGYAYWQVSHPAECTPYRQRYFENLQPTDAKQPLGITCEQALNLPATTSYATTFDGLKINYRVYPASSEDKPLLLHVPGITSDWLNGARYVESAQRMGFQLVVMEMRNHGNSEVNGKGVRYGCAENEDVIAVVNALSKTYPDRSLLLWASSGATMAVINAGNALHQVKNLKGVVLENPISSLADVARVKSPGLPGFVYQGFLKSASWRGGVDFNACAPIQHIAELKQPTLVTVSLQDHLTPEWMAKKVYGGLTHAQKQLKVYPQGLHERIWNGQPQQYETDIQKFWSRL